MVTQIPDRLLKRDDVDQHLYNQASGSYPITYGKLREALCNNKKEGVKFISYLIQAIASAPAEMPLGIYILSLWTGIPSAKISREADVSVFITDGLIAELVQSCSHARVTIIQEALLSYKRDLIKKVSRESASPILLTKDYLGEFIQDGINELSAPSIKLLTATSKAGMNISDLQLETALSVIASQLETSTPGLYSGAHGIAHDLATIIEAGLLPADSIYTGWINQLLSKEGNDYSLRHGIAGYGIANLACSRFVPQATLDKRLKKYTSILAETMPHNSGFANGLAGMTYFLLVHAQHSDNKKSLQAGLGNLICLTERAQHIGGTTHWPSPNNHLVNSWDEDSATHTSLVFMKAHELTGWIVYKRYAEAALYAHDIYVTHDNLSEYAALGNILLNAYQSLKERMWLSRSTWIAQVMLQLKGQTTTEKENILLFLLNYYNHLS